MTTTKGRPRRPRRGWLSGAKPTMSGRGSTPLWQWIVGVPLLLAMAGAILFYLYATYVDPKLGVGARRVRTEVLERFEKRLPNGALDTTGSWLKVRIDGKDLQLAPRLPDWTRVAKGDLIEVEVSGGAATGLQAYSWQALPAGPPPAEPR